MKLLKGGNKRPFMASAIWAKRVGFSLCSIVRIGVLGLLASAMLMAQSPYGRILGRVTDSSGAVVPNASVECVNIETNVVTTAKSNSEGNYELPNLIPGRYRLSVSVAGFKTYGRGPMELRVGDALNIPVALEVGTQAETITVTTDAPLLESASATTGQVLDSRRVAELPVPGSNPLFLTLLAANVTMYRSPFATFTPDANTFPVEEYAAGTSRNQSAQSIDGVQSMQGNQAAGIVPPPEILQEVKVTTTTYDASQGHFTGAQVNMVTKSGTNDLHGAVAVWNQNTAFNSLEYFTKRAILDPSTGPPTHEKIRDYDPYSNWFRYRGTVGGPVYIPKLYNGRNRTFFQYGFDHYLLPYPTNDFRTVPTEAQRNGDFSSLLGIKDGNDYRLFDPFSAVAEPGGHVRRTPLADNKIPANLISPVAKNILKYYPMPNTTPLYDTGEGNHYGSPNSSVDYTANFARVDQVIKDNHRMFVSYNRYCLYALQNIYFGKPFGDVYPTGSIQDNCHNAVTVDNVITPSATWVLDFRYGLVRFYAYRPSTVTGFDTNTLGMSSQLMTGVDPTKTTLPQLTIDGVQGIGAASGRESGQLYHNFTFSATNMRGNHALRFGVDFRTYASTNNNWGNITPSYEFRSNSSTGWLKETDSSAASPFGQGLASFLYGLPTGGSISRNASSALMSKMFAWYVQDDWKVTRRLTVNLGIRHELEYPVTERFNRANMGFDFTTASPVQTAAVANFQAAMASGAYANTPVADITQFKVLGGQTFAGDNNRNLTKLHPRNFMPRIGVTYQLDENTVVRAGYAIYFESLAADIYSVRQNGYSQSTSIVPSPDNGLTFRVNLQNYPFQDGILTPVGASGGLNTFLGSSITFNNPEIHQAYAQRWNFNIQRQIGQRVLVEIGYTGNRGTGLGITNDWNSLPLQYLSRNQFQRDTQFISYMSGNVTNPFRGIPQFAATGHANATIGKQQLLMAFPQFSGTSGVRSTEADGFSWYHGFSVRAERRFANGFTVQGNWTWSKFMQATSRINGLYDSLNHVISDGDRPHQLSINGIYELPFGKGKPFLNAVPGWADRVVGGWQASAVYIAQSGSPMAFGNVLFIGDIHDIPLPKSERTIDRYFNTDAGFNKVSSQQLANNYRMFPTALTGARNPGVNMWNMSAIKKIPLRERVDLELRAEAQGAMNHPNWNGPNLSPTSGSFGKITSSQGGRTITLQGKLNW